MAATVLRGRDIRGVGLGFERKREYRVERHEAAKVLIL